MNKKLLVGGVLILALVAVVVFVFFGNQLKGGFLGKESSAKPSLPKMVEAAGKKVGTMVDSVTRLDRVSQGSANQMVSEYTMVNIPSRQVVDPNALSAAKEKIRARACEVPDVKVIVTHDVTIVYRYRAVNGDLLIEVELTKANCRA